MLKKILPWLVFLILGVSLMKGADYAVDTYQNKLSDEWQQFFSKHDCKLAEVFISIHRRGWVCDDGIEYYVDDQRFDDLNKLLIKKSMPSTPIPHPEPTLEKK